MSATLPTTEEMSLSPGPRPSAVRSVMKRALIGVLCLTIIVAGGAWLMHAAIEDGGGAAGVTDSEAAARAQVLGAVERWAYQVHDLDLASLARSHFDLIVIDPRAVGSEGAGTVAGLRRKADGARRIVLAYLSIGEAEDKRAYWRRGWVTSPGAGSNAGRDGTASRSYLETSSIATASIPAVGGTVRIPSALAPSWLGPETSRSSGSFIVRYWDSGWQSLLFGSPDAALDRIVALGFDGVWLDKAGAHAIFSTERSSAAADMGELVGRLADYVRQRNSEFLVILQNAEELLADPAVERSIDGAAKERLLYGLEGPERENDDPEVAASLHYLELARRNGHSVFVAEYLEDAVKIESARRQLIERGFVPSIASGASRRIEKTF
jgi:cysteinyl-tRNA synthetase